MLFPHYLCAFVRSRTKLKIKCQQHMFKLSFPGYFSRNITFAFSSRAADPNTSTELVLKQNINRHCAISKVPENNLT